MNEENLPQVGGASFEDMKNTNNYGASYWSARELQPLLGDATEHHCTQPTVTERKRLDPARRRPVVPQRQVGLPASTIALWRRTGEPRTRGQARPRACQECATRNGQPGPGLRHCVVPLHLPDRSGPPMKLFIAHWPLRPSRTLCFQAPADAEEIFTPSSRESACDEV